jgi:hypothetical protein
MKGIGWSSLIAGLIILVPGVVGLLTGRLALFASLGLAALMHAYLPEPRLPVFTTLWSRTWEGLFPPSSQSRWFQIAYAPSIFDMQYLSVARVGAAVLALVLPTAI